MKFFKTITTLLAVSMFSSACQNNRPAGHPETEVLTMLVGTYTDAGSRGIYSFRLNQNTGETCKLAETEIGNPSFLTLSDDNRYVYAVSEYNDNRACVTAFTFDKEKGILRKLNSQPTLGEDPCHVATDGRRVVTANYSGGSMTTFPIRYDGSLSASDTVFMGSTGGTNPARQTTPHMHCCVFSPDSNYLFVTDFSSDQILKYALSPKEEQPKPLSDAVSLAPGSGPRHLTFSPDGRHAYLISELSGKVSAFSYTDGRLIPIQTITADTLRAQGSADIHLSPDGKYLYASNRLQNDGIAIFAVDPQTGKLAKVGYQPTGKHPRNFCITPNGKFLLVACRDDNVIQIFERDLHTGLLKETMKTLKLSHPVCIRLAV